MSDYHHVFYLINLFTVLLCREPSQAQLISFGGELTNNLCKTLRSCDFLLSRIDVDGASFMFNVQLPCRSHPSATDQSVNRARLFRHHILSHSYRFMDYTGERTDGPTLNRKV